MYEWRFDSNPNPNPNLNLTLTITVFSKWGFYMLFVDYDAPLSEAGDVTEKFWALFKVFKEYNPIADDQGWVSIIT